MRNKEYLKNVDKIVDTTQTDFKELFQRDKFDCLNSDIILVNLLNRKSTVIGSLFELAWGYLSNKYCIVVVQKDSIYYTHPFVRETASVLFDDLEDAVDYIAATFGE